MNKKAVMTHASHADLRRRSMGGLTNLESMNDELELDFFKDIYSDQGAQRNHCLSPHERP
jgi:hypothetical protein